MKDKFNLEVKKILKEAEKEMFDLNHPYVGSEHMLLGVLKIDEELKNMLASYGLTYDTFRNNLINIVGRSHKKSELALYTPLLKRIISDAIEEAEEVNNGVVEPNHLILGMLEEGEGVGIRILLNMGVDIEGIYNSLVKKTSNGKKSKNSLLLDIGKIVSPPREEHIYKREKEIDNLIEILLRKNKNNPLLIGEAGVGKTAIVEELARRIEAKDVPDALYDTKIVEIDTGSMISGTRYRGEFEDRLEKIIKEVIEDKKIILFIDEIHTIINCGGAEGAVDAANILKPYLARGDLKVIGATTLKEYRSSIYKDKAFDRRFQIITVEEPSLKDTEYILENIKENYERHHNVIISKENIKDIVKYSDKYIYNRFNPDKAIDILDSVCAHVQMSRPRKNNALGELNKKKEKFLSNKKYREALELELQIRELEENTSKIQITKQDILKVIEYRANMPVLDNFNEKIMNLASVIKTNLYGQDECIDKICDALKEKYLFDNRKPLAIMILGESGVGKTFLATQIANTLFGTKQFLRLDMSEMSGEGAINKLLGSAQGYVGYEDDALFGKIKDYPYSILLLDEVERASYKVQKLFADIIEKGYIRNAKGEVIHFENTTIIMTSNSPIKKSLGFTEQAPDLDSIVDKSLSGLINKTIVLNPINAEIAQKYIKRESKNIKLTSKDIKEIIERAKIDENGMRGIQKELNKYKISKLLSKV